MNKGLACLGTAGRTATRRSETGGTHPQGCSCSVTSTGRTCCSRAGRQRAPRDLLMGAWAVPGGQVMPQASPGPGEAVEEGRVPKAAVLARPFPQCWQSPEALPSPCPVNIGGKQTGSLCPLVH